MFAGALLPRPLTPITPYVAAPVVVALTTQLDVVLVQLFHVYDVGLSVHVAVRVTGVLGTGNAADALMVQTGMPAAGCALDCAGAQNTTGFGLPMPSAA